MSTTVLQKRRILFVDDEAPFLEMIERMMGALSQGNWDVLTAQNTGKAFSVLQDSGVNMVVIDVQMPVVDGLQFLTLLNRRYPNLQKVVMTGFANDNYRAACLSNGAEMFLEKPKTPEGFESLFATLNELLKWQPEEGFRGVLRRVGLQDVIQMECLSRNSSILEISTRKATGRIFIKDGAVIHAEFESRTGEDAFNYLLTLKGGEFKLRSFVEPQSRSIEGQWEFLLMEAARLRDEIDSDAESETSEESRVPATPAADTTMVEAAPAQPSKAKSKALEELTTTSLDSIPDIFPAARPAAVTADAVPAPQVAVQSVVAPLEEKIETAPEPEFEVAVADQTKIAPRQIDEVLICSSHGDVLYEWQCRNSDVWVNFLEFVSQKSRQVSQGFVLGQFDRLEIQSDDSRMIAHIGASGGILVRSNALVGDGVGQPLE